MIKDLKTKADLYADKIALYLLSHDKTYEIAVGATKTRESKDKLHEKWISIKNRKIDKDSRGTHVEETFK